MLRHRGFAIGFQALVLACILGLGGGRAEAVSPARVEQVRIGFDGSYKVGFWTPVWVRVTAAETGYEGRLLIETPDADGTAVQFELPAEPLRLAAGQTATILRYAKFGRLDGGLTIILRDSGGQVQRERIAGRLLPKVLSSDTELLLTLGNDIGLPAVAQRESGDRRVAALQVTEPAELPDEWYGYDGIDVVAIPTSGEPLAARMNDRQFAALRRWVQLGGHVVLCVGEAGTRITEPGARGSVTVTNGAPPPPDSATNAGTPTVTTTLPLTRLREWLPGELVGVVTLTNASALENYAKAVQRLELGGAASLKLCMVARPQGRVELSDQAVLGEQPMIVQTPFGLGQVTFVAVDLDQPPLREWTGRTRVLRSLLQREVAADTSRSKRQQTGQVARVGYRDLSGQLRSALDQFTGVSFVAFSWVAGIIMIYIVLIGPVDYFFLRNVLRRMEWTWITFPLIACGFILLALMLNQQLKGGRMLINQIDLVDADLASGVVRGQTWAHLYSPHTAVYDIQFEPAWQLVPEPATHLSTVQATRSDLSLRQSTRQPLADQNVALLSQPTVNRPPRTTPPEQLTVFPIARLRSFHDDDGVRDPSHLHNVVGADSPAQKPRDNASESIVSQPTRRELATASWQTDPIASAAAATPRSLLSWQGLPGSGLGGMEARALSASFGQPYAVTRQDEVGTMTQLPVQVASTAPLSGLWWSDSFTSDQHQLVRTTDGLLEGQLVNPLPVELTNCLVLYSIWAYRLDQTRGALQPGQVIRIDRERPLNLEWRLTRRRVQEKRNVTTPWDPHSQDVPRLLEMMMFHEAAGGENYTVLSHHYEKTIDFSNHLRNGRAILLGQATEPAARLQFSNSEPPASSRTWTFCRVIFPVSPKP